jgi:heme-degrading monooxygenase HmoA
MQSSGLVVVNEWHPYNPKEFLMYARHVSLNLKSNQREELTQMFEREILPLLQKQNGFTDELTLVTPDGRQVVAISLWENKENADRYNREAYPQVLKTLARVVEGTPEVRGYEVAFSTFHKTAATR